MESSIIYYCWLYCRPVVPAYFHLRRQPTFYRQPNVISNSPCLTRACSIPCRLQVVKRTNVVRILIKKKSSILLDRRMTNNRYTYVVLISIIIFRYDQYKLSMGIHGRHVWTQKDNVLRIYANRSHHIGYVFLAHIMAINTFQIFRRIDVSRQ